MNFAALASMAGKIGKAAWASPAGKRTIIGAGVGAAYGAMSDNTSILGGAVMGAAGSRYLGAGFKRASIAGHGLGFKGSVSAYGQAFAKGVINRARLDWKGVSMATNRGIGRIQGIAANRAMDRIGRRLR